MLDFVAGSLTVLQIAMLPVNTVFFSWILVPFPSFHSVECLFTPRSPLFLLPTAQPDISLYFSPRRVVVVRSNGGLASGRFKSFVKYDVRLKRRLFESGNEFPTCSNNVTWHNATCQVGEQKHFLFMKWQFLGISKQWILCGFTVAVLCDEDDGKRRRFCSVCVRSSG